MVASADLNSGQASKRLPECWTRVEIGERGFVECCGEHTDGVVIALRFDTPASGGASDAVEVSTAADLKRAALASRVPFLIDLETWRLPFLTGADDRSFGRDAQTVMARAVTLPLTASQLNNDRTAQALVRAGVSTQAGAGLIFAPDFQVASLDDPWLEINLRCLRLAQMLVRDRPVAAWIHVRLETMRAGLLPFLADRYARALQAGSTVVLTVSDMRSETLTPADLATYLQALDAFRAQGLDVIVDRAGDASIPAVATYASGCMLGTRIYRSAPPSPRFELEFNPKIRLRYYVGKQGRRVDRDVARARHARGVLPSCVHPGCTAVKASKKENLALRLHNAHELRQEVRRARELGASRLVAEWRNASLRHQRCWAQAIALVDARKKEA